MEKPILQVALDLLEIKRAVQIAEESILGGADWIEVGTPLIKSEGIRAVSVIREKFPQKIIVADMKVADTGTLEVEMAAKAGASIVCILAEADNSVVLEATRAARLYGVKLMADLINSKNPVDRARELEAMGMDYIVAHIGIDQQMIGMTSNDLLEKLVGEVSVPLAVAGGLDAENAAKAVTLGAKIIIIGGAIVRSADVTESTRKIRESIDHPIKQPHQVMNIEGQIRHLLERVSTPNISDAMHRKGAMQGIRPMCGDLKMIGRAVTVQTFAGDWAKPVEAIDVANAGDVIVIYNDGDTNVAPWGELATMSCMNKGVSGVVIDGAVRDIDDIKKLHLPIFAKAIVPNAGEPKGFGEINTEIQCGAQSVRPGDWIVGDENGVVVIPMERAYEIARRAVEVKKNEERIREEIKRGDTLSQITELLKWEKK